MVVVGVTGGIGCGKSTVAAMLARRGAVVIDADDIARQVTAPEGASYRAIVDHFGADVVGADGKLDRAAIAARVFSDPSELAALNAITHPAIGAAILARLGQLRGTGKLVVLDIPLLSEATVGSYGLTGVVVVDAPVEVAVSRLVDQRGLVEADAEARVRSQPRRENRRLLGDVVVDNGGSRADLEASVEGIWAWMHSLVGPGALDGSDGGSVQEATSADGVDQSAEHY